MTGFKFSAILFLATGAALCRHAATRQIEVPKVDLGADEVRMPTVFRDGKPTVEARIKVEGIKTVEAADAAALRKIVDDCNRQAVDAFKKGDMKAVASGYADDATIYFPRGQKVHGREAIDKYWSNVKGAKDWKLEVSDVGGTLDAIYEVGKSTVTTDVDGKKDTYVCDYVVIWKRQKDGSYKAHTDIFN
jgi:ketosteroid isomerase-like protein